MRKGLFMRKKVILRFVNYKLKNINLITSIMGLPLKAKSIKRFWTSYQKRKFMTQTINCK